MTKQEEQAVIDEARSKFKGKSGVPYSSSDKIAKNAKGRREQKKLDQQSHYKYFEDPRKMYRIKTRKSFD